jgi:hypothetical protein
VLSLAAVLIAPLLVLLDGGLALARGWSARPAAFFAMGLAALPVAAGILFLLGKRTRSALAVRRRSFTVAGGGILAALLLGELATRPFRIVVLDELTHLRQPLTRVTFRPSPEIMPGIDGESRYVINSLGIRGDELPAAGAAYRILCVGGSTTECIYLDQDETWAGLLQTKLRLQSSRDIWVGDVGVSGYATPHHLRFVLGSTLIDEMDCLVFLTGINDLLWTIGGRDFSVVPPRPASTVRPVFLRTALGRLARAAHHRLTIPRSAEVVENETGSNYLERRRIRSAAVPFADLELELDAYVGYGRRIDALIAACRERRIRAVFLSHPALWKESMSPEEESLLWMGDRRGKFASARSLRLALDRFNELLIEICARRGAEVVDLRAMNGDPRYFYDDCHLNEEGAEYVASALARYFAARGLTSRGEAQP